jgi:hypothetical protein
MSRPLVATLTIHTSPCSALDWQRHVIQGPFHLQFKVTAEIATAHNTQLHVQGIGVQGIGEGGVGGVRH